LDIKRSQTKPKISGTVPTDRHATIPDGSAPISLGGSLEGVNSKFRIATKLPYNWSAELIFGAIATAGRAPSKLRKPNISEFRIAHEPLSSACFDDDPKLLKWGRGSEVGSPPVGCWRTQSHTESFFDGSRWHPSRGLVSDTQEWLLAGRGARKPEDDGLKQLKLNLTLGTELLT
jgi:hypothetical protein